MSDSEQPRVALPELVKLLADSAADIIYRVTFVPELAYEYISPAVEDVLGYTPSEFYADPGLGLRTVHPDDRGRASDPNAPPQVLRSIRRDGRIVFLEQRLRVVRDAAGNVVAIEGVCRDVSERVAAEQSQQRVAANFRSLFDAAPLIVGVTRKGEVVYVNAAAANFLGVPRESLIGARALSLLGPEERARLTPLLDGGLPEGHTTALSVYRLRRPDGVEVVAEVNSIGVQWDGAPALLSLGRDITERTELLHRLAASERLASLGTLAAGVAHEINNPLAYVATELDASLRSLERLAGGSAELSAVLSSLRGARDGVDRIARIVRDVRSVGQPEPVETQAVSVTAAIERAIELTSAQFDGKLSIVRHFGVVQPALADEARLVQVFSNLLLNAVDALENGRRGGRIEINVQQRDSLVVAEVSDDGPGIPPDRIGRIFDPFFTTKAVGAGMGLGLAICHGILTQLGGTIEVESEVGRGATFRVSLPALRRNDTERPDPPRPETRPERARILFVDDEVDFCTAMSRLLGTEHEVVTTTRARKALERLRAGEQFDLILCDLMMPEMTGMEFFEALRALPGVDLTRVVFMTGGTFGDSARRFLEEIPNVCLQKPFDSGKIQSFLNDRPGSRRSGSR